jgi:hypothetical protein
MFARKQTFCADFQMDPPSQCLQEQEQDTLVSEKSKEKSTKVHQHEQAEEDPSSLVDVGYPASANIQPCSFLLGLMIFFFAFSARVLTLAFFGEYTDPTLVTLFSVVWGCSTSAIIIITLCFFRASDRLIYPLSGNPSEDNRTIIGWDIECRLALGMLLGVCSACVINDILLGMDGHIKYSAGMLVGVMMLSFIFKTIIIRDIECRFGLGMLLGVCSAWVLMDILLGMDGRIKYSAGMLVGVMMLSLIFQFCSNRFAPISSSASKHRTIDQAEMWC